MLPAPPERRSGGPLRVVYTGRFYARWRTPEHLLRAIAGAKTSHRDSLEVVFAGTTDVNAVQLASRLGLDDTVTFSGRLAWAESMSLAMTADVLVVIDAPGDMNLFLPSKLIEYLPLGIPLLGLTPRVGASADVLRALGYPVVAPTDTDAIARELRSLIEAKRSGRLHASPQHAAASARYDIRRTSAEFADVLTSCLRSH
jgi:glycosyltransferase involved in cell wall biosynthesis